MKELFEEIRDFLRQLVRLGMSDSDIKKEIKIFISRKGMRANVEDVLKNIQNDYIQKHLGDLEKMQGFYNILKQTRSDFGKMDGQIQQGILQVVDKYLGNKYNRLDFERALLPELKGVENWANAVRKTAEMSFNRAATIHSAQEDGISEFIYTGPANTQRPICLKYLGKVLTIEQIKEVDAGTSLPFMYYCGGYGCRHELLPYV